MRSDPSVVFLAQGSHSYWNAHSLGWGHFSSGHQPACAPLPVPRHSHLQAFVQAGPSIWNVDAQSPLIKLLSSFKAWHQMHLHQEGALSLPSCWNPFLPFPGLLSPRTHTPVKMTEIGSHALTGLAMRELSKPFMQSSGMSSLDRMGGGLAKAWGGGKQEVLRP